MSERTLQVRDLGLTEYQATWDQMRAFTDARDQDTLDELWLTEHSPVFTLGQAGKDQHILLPSTIPVVRTDRGGQVTYHGPGQIVGYFLFDLRRQHLGVHDFVSWLEETMIRTVGAFDIEAERITGQPGIYVAGRKIGALGLRVRRGATYHGISLNVNMDLSPFDNINPCGIQNLRVTQVADFVEGVALQKVQDKFVRICKTSWLAQVD